MSTDSRRSRLSLRRPRHVSSLVCCLLAAGTSWAAQTSVPLIPDCAAGAAVAPAPAPVIPNVPPGPVSLKVVGQVGGPTQAVAVNGPYAYVGVGHQLIALNVSDPAAPREVGASAALDDVVLDIAIAGNFAYVAAGSAGLVIFDIASPEQPRLRGSRTARGWYAEDVDVTGETVFVAAGPAGLRVVRVTDPANPTEIASAVSGSYAFGVTHAGERVYVAGAGAGLLIVDVSSPALAVEVGRYATEGFAYGVAAAGHTVYLADGWGGIRILDTTDVWAPRQLASLATAGWAMHVEVIGSTLYVAEAGAGMHLINVANVRDPVEIGKSAIPAGHARRIAVSRATAFVADRNHGLHLIDVTVPSKPVEASLYSPLGFADGAAVSGSVAVIAGATYGVRVVDLSAAAEPRETATMNTAPIRPNLVTLDNGFGYLGAGKTLFIADVHEPSNPRLTTYSFPFGTPRNQVVHGGDLVVANEWGLRLINISDPRAPCQLNFMNFTGKGEGGNGLDDPITDGVAVAGEIAYTASGIGGMWIIDISNPRSPVKVGEFKLNANGPDGQPTTARFDDIAVGDGFAYVIAVVAGRASLLIFDLADPRNPKLRGTFLLASEVGGLTGPFLAVARTTVFAALGEAGIEAIDVRDPDHPAFAGLLAIDGSASSVVMGSNRLYVAAEEGGLLVVDVVAAAGAGERGVTDDVASGSALAFPRRIECQVPASPAVESQPEQGLVAPSARTCTVTTATDSGGGSLRDCLEQSVKGDSIAFDPSVFPPQSPVTIKPLTPLPFVRRGSVTIDASNAGVILDGSLAPANTDGLFIASDGNVVRGLQIIHFSGDGIRVQGAGNTIGGDRFVGTGPIGSGNLVSGNGQAGINLWSSSTDNRVVGNIVGLDVTGSRSFGNLNGVTVSTSNFNTVGGPAPGDRNVISGNTVTDVDVGGEGNRVIGNYVGLDASGRVALSNPSNFGLALEGSAPANLVASNTIVAQNGRAILIADEGSSYNVIRGNLVGLSATGDAMLGGPAKILVLQPFNRIGGSHPEDRNVVVGGISAFGGRATDNIFVGNYVGLDARGRGTGVNGGIATGGSHNLVEGNLAGSMSSSGRYNYIAANLVGTDVAGTTLSGTAGDGISISGGKHNAVHGNHIAGANQDGINVTRSADFNWLHANRVVASSRVGIEINASAGNRVDGNVLINNAQNGFDAGSLNEWDDGRSGNYWSDYSGVDANGDGIGDSPYASLQNGADRFPLVAPPTDNPLPSIANVTPSFIRIGGSDFLLTVRGTNFVRSSTVLWSGSPRPTTFVNAAELTASITTSDIAQAALISIVVVSASPGGGASNVMPFAVSAPRRRAVGR